MIKVSLIIINYNGKIFIADCLRVLKKQVFKEFEIVLIDNGSSDGSLIEIQKLLNESLIMPVVKIISLEKNIGFAKGNLEGLKHACGEYIALLNNDTEVDKGWLEELTKAMDTDHKIGICGSKMIVHGTEILDSAGDQFSKALKGFKRGEGENAFLYDKKEYVFGACAGAALYRRKMLEEIGFLDEDFFLIHEDTDLNIRAQLCGWKVVYVPTAIVYHKVGSSIGKMSDMAIYYTLRNSEFVRIKDIPLGVFIRCLPGFLIGTLMEFIFFAIRHKRLRLYFKAKMDAIRFLPGMLKKRSVILKNKKVSNQYLMKIMTPVWEKNFLRTKIKKFLYT